MSIFAQTAKATFYKTNGSGRDTYIYGNNGGLTQIQEMPQIQPPIGTFSSPKHISHGYKKPLINSKSIHYHGNGSGRDSYIQINQGGFMADGYAGQQKNTFYNGLRQYDKSPQRYNRNARSPVSKHTQQDFLMDGQQAYLSKMVKTQFNLLNRYQKSLDARLSVPKLPTGVNESNTFTQVMQKSSISKFGPNNTLDLTNKRGSL